MKKALLYGLSLAMLLSLAACHKPQADQQEPSQPDPATTSVPADVSNPEPIKDTPDTEPPAQPVPEPVKDTTPEPEPPEDTAPEAVSEPEPEQIPVTPAENKTATPPKKTPPKAQPEPKPVEAEAPQQTVPETPPVSNEPAQASGSQSQASKPSGGQQQTQQPAEDTYDASQGKTLEQLAAEMKAAQEEAGGVGAGLGRNLTPEEIEAMSKSLQLAP